MNSPLRTHLAVMTLSLYLLSGPASGERTFYWSMEAEKPDVVPSGTDSTPAYYPPVETARTETQARAGKFSLDASGKWKAATFDNPTNDPIWATPNQGAIRFWWKYTGQSPGGMLFQLTGKSKDKALDTNDGLGVRLRGNTELRFGYGWDDAKQSASVRYKPKEPFVADRWYRVTVRWNRDTAPHLSLQVDDETPVTSDKPFGETRCKAWHQILIGNDTPSTPPGLYIDDFEIWNDSAMTPATPATQPAVPLQPGG